MSYREPPNPVFMMFLVGIGIGFIVGLLVATALNDNYWQKKLVKEGKYHWVADPVTGATNLVPKP